MVGYRERKDDARICVNEMDALHTRQSCNIISTLVVPTRAWLLHFKVSKKVTSDQALSTQSPPTCPNKLLNKVVSMP